MKPTTVGGAGPLAARHQPVPDGDRAQDAAAVRLRHAQERPRRDAPALEDAVRRRKPEEAVGGLRVAERPRGLDALSRLDEGHAHGGFRSLATPYVFGGPMQFPRRERPDAYRKIKNSSPTPYFTLAEGMNHSSTFRTVHFKGCVIRIAGYFAHAGYCCARR